MVTCAISLTTICHYTDLAFASNWLPYPFGNKIEQTFFSMNKAGSHTSSATYLRVLKTITVAETLFVQLILN